MKTTRTGVDNSSNNGSSALHVCKVLRSQIARVSKKGIFVSKMRRIMLTFVSKEELGSIERDS